MAFAYASSPSLAFGDASFLPAHRGVASEMVFERLVGEPHRGIPAVRPPIDVWGDDFQILLWALQQLAYRPFANVDPAWEREPSLRHLRDRLEEAYLNELRRRVTFTRRSGESAVAAIGRLLARADGPSLSSWMAEHASLQHLREFVAHRAAYQCQEADPHTFAIPRLAAGRAKSALLKIQLDEYGNAESGQSHAELFAQTAELLDVAVDIDALPAATLRTNTLLNLFAGSRSLLGACIGHLAVFETCSVEPMSRYAATVRRLLPSTVAARAARFFDVHVAADGWHEELALTELVDGFAEQYRTETDLVVFGAAALMHVEGEFTRALLDAWAADRTSLRVPTREVAARRLSTVTG